MHPYYRRRARELTRLDPGELWASTEAVADFIRRLRDAPDPEHRPVEDRRDDVRRGRPRKARKL